jgi:hypothetical protein
MASNKNVRVWTTVTGLLTTLSGTVMGGIRAMGQPRRAEDRVRRLERIVEHIGRLYYSVGSADDQQQHVSHQQTIEQTWKMIDEEEDRTELEERKAGSFAFQIPAPQSVSSPPASQSPQPELMHKDGDSDEAAQQLVRPRLKMRRASTLLGKHYPSSDHPARV